MGQLPVLYNVHDGVDTYLELYSIECIQEVTRVYGFYMGQPPVLNNVRDEVDTYLELYIP